MHDFSRCKPPGIGEMARAGMWRIGSLSIWLALLFGVGGCAVFGSRSSRGGYVPAQAASGEVLALRPPLGWQKLRDAVSGRQRIIIYLPQRQGPENWRQMMVYRIVEGRTDRGLARWLSATQSILARRCKHAATHRLNVAESNGYSAAQVLQVCRGDRITGKDQVVIMRIILGKERVYMVQWISRLAVGAPLPRESLLERWSASVDASRVCDTRGTSHPCPQWLGDANTY